MTQQSRAYDPTTDRDRLRRYRLLLSAQIDEDIREMLERLIDETEVRLFAARKPAYKSE